MWAGSQKKAWKVTGPPPKYSRHRCSPIIAAEWFESSLKIKDTFGLALSVCVCVCVCVCAHKELQVTLAMLGEVSEEWG